MFVTVGVGVGGCKDPVDDFLDARDDYYAAACECVPQMIAGTASSSECYQKKQITPEERECVELAIERSDAAENGYGCRGEAEEDFAECLDGQATCDAGRYAECESSYKERSDGCPDVPDSIENDVKKCLD